MTRVAVALVAGLLSSIGYAPQTSMSADEPKAARENFSAFERIMDTLAGDLVSQLVSSETRRVALADFENVNVPRQNGQFVVVFNNELYYRLAKAGRGHVSIIERQQLARVLKEQELGTSVLFDSNSAVRVGKLVGAQVLVVGLLTDIGSGIRVNASAVDVETGDNIGSSDAVLGKKEIPASILGPTSVPVAPPDMLWFDGPVPEEFRRNRPPADPKK